MIEASVVVQTSCRSQHTQFQQSHKKATTQLKEIEQLKQIQSSLEQLLLYHQQEETSMKGNSTTQIRKSLALNKVGNHDDGDEYSSNKISEKKIFLYTVQAYRKLIGSRLNPSIMASTTSSLSLPIVFNGVNPSYPGLRVLHKDPPIFAVDNFLTDVECKFLIQNAQDSFTPAPVVGNGSGEISISRTSSTCYLAREDIPIIMNKVRNLTGKPIEHCELPQVGRYLPQQYYLQHYDAFDLSTPDGCRFALNGGQRIVTVLIYLNTLSPSAGGATCFPSLHSSLQYHRDLSRMNQSTSLQVHPTKGTAIVFFPATIDGLLDTDALHAAMPVVSAHEIKYVSQIWIRQSIYNGTPSKRLLQPLIQ